MGAINSGYLFFIVIGLGLILLVVSLVKKAIKLVIFILILLVAYSLYNIVVKGVSPIDEIRGYKTDIKYTESIADYSSKIKTSVDNLKSLTAGKIDSATINKIKAEDENLHNYRNEVASLKHTARFNFFQDKYIGFLEGIIASSDGVTNLVNSGAAKNASQIKDLIGKVSSNFSSLYDLKTD